MSTLTAPAAGLALQTSEHSAFTPTNSKSSPAASEPPPSSPEMEADDVKCRSPGVSVSPCTLFSRSFAAHRSASSGASTHPPPPLPPPPPPPQSSLNYSSGALSSSSQSTRSPSPPSSPESPNKWSEHRPHRRARGSSPERPGSGKENDGAVVPHNPAGHRFTSFSVVDILAQPSKKRTPPPSPSPPPPPPTHSPVTTAATTTVVPMRVGLGVGVGMSGVNALTDTRWSGNQSQHAGLPNWYLGAPRFSAATSKYNMKRRKTKTQ